MENVDLADINYLKQQHIHIGIPAVGGIVSSATFQSYLNWVGVAHSTGVQTTINIFDKDENIAKARNALIAQFMGSIKATHLLLVDPNIEFDPWDGLALVSTKKHVISGAYNKDYLDRQTTQKLVKEGFIHEVLKARAGFMLISREALIYMQDHADIEQFRDDMGLDPNAAPFLKTYFEPKMRKGVFESDDYEFCHRWRGIGGHVWAHMQVQPRVMIKP